MPRKTNQQIFLEVLESEAKTVLKDEFLDGYKFTSENKSDLYDFIADNIWEYLTDDIRELIEEFISNEDVEERE